MMETSDSLRSRPAIGDGPAVLNVRRPGAGTARPEEPLHARFKGGEPEASSLPQTLLRLPDLSVAARRLKGVRINYSEILQWTGIALGALLALWLIFGNRPSSSPAEDTPAAVAPKEASAPAALPQRTIAPDETTAPAWQPPAASTAEPTPPEMPSEWDDSAGGSRSMAPAYTAQRPEPPGGSAPEWQSPSDPQPLGVTVPVQP